MDAGSPAAAIPIAAPISNCSIIRACEDENLIGAWLRPLETWKNWLILLKVIFGLPLGRGPGGELEVYQRFTGRLDRPQHPHLDAYLIVGRRSGKSVILAVVGVFMACFYDWRRYLKPGEPGKVVIIASDRKQARTIFRYICGIIDASPFLRELLAEPPSTWRVILKNGVEIEIHTASWRAIRSYTVIAALLDEAAFWRNDESANPASEIITALKPCMATIPGARMLVASSPYAQSGPLFDAVRDWWGRVGPTLVWRAPTQEMNKTLPQAVIDAAFAEDPVKAATEYGAEFRRDLEALLSQQVVEACTIWDRYEIPPQPNSEWSYVAFVDPSGGSSDHFSLTIAHAEPMRDRIVVDCVRDVPPPFSPDNVVIEFCRIVKSYGIFSVTGDAYGGEWPRERFNKQGVSYEVSEQTVSELYLACVPLLNAGRVDLLDNVLLRTQLQNLERRVGRSGKDAIGHPKGAHDDQANTVAGACVMCSGDLNVFDLEHVIVGNTMAAATAPWAVGQGRPQGTGNYLGMGAGDEPDGY